MVNRGGRHHSEAAQRVGRSGWRVGSGWYRAFQLGAGRGGVGDKGQSGRKGGGPEACGSFQKNGGGLFKNLMPKTKDTQNHSFWRYHFC